MGATFRGTKGREQLAHTVRLRSGEADGVLLGAPGFGYPKNTRRPFKLGLKSFATC